ncbi:MAG: hypothetical protein ACRDJ9_18340 [Dehalococcoidia bacterium]
MNLIVGFARFWYDFIVGDDWKIAVAVVLALGLTLAVSSAGIVAGTAVTVAGAALLLGSFALALVIDTRQR